MAATPGRGIIALVPRDALAPSRHSLWAAFRRASLRACLRLSDECRNDVPAEEFATKIQPLADSLWRVSQGEKASTALALTGLPLKDAIAALRTELLIELRTVPEQASVPDVVRLLSAFDEMERYAARDAAQEFMCRMRDGDALAALVEVAHDMRSPLASIVLLVETVRNGQSGPVTPVQDRQLKLVYAATLGLSLLADDLVSFGRGSESLTESEPQPFSLAELMQSVREIVLPIAAEKGIELRTTLPQGDWRLGYAPALHRVLLNLVTNALKFTEAGHVELGAVPLSRDRLQLYVRDTGRGMPADQTSALFNAFGGGETSTGPTFSSSGLGLALCRKLVTRMGGDLSVENCEEGGSRFFFAIDLPPAQHD